MPLNKLLRNVLLLLLSRVAVKNVRDAHCRVDVHITWRTQFPETGFDKTVYLGNKKSKRNSTFIHKDLMLLQILNEGPTLMAEY